MDLVESVTVDSDLILEAETGSLDGLVSRKSGMMWSWKSRSQRIRLVRINIMRTLGAGESFIQEWVREPISPFRQMSGGFGRGSIGLTWMSHGPRESRGASGTLIMKICRTKSKQSSSLIDQFRNGKAGHGVGRKLSFPPISELVN